MFGTEEPRRGGGAGDRLAALAASWQIPFDEAQAASLLAYADSLLRWSARINLTAARTVDVLIADHFPDAFALAQKLDQPASLIDVGSGGGLPALPLALIRPELSILLCEPIAKKGAFLRTAIRELGLGARVELAATRGEKLAEEHPAAFDAAISRATLPAGEMAPPGPEAGAPRGPGVRANDPAEPPGADPPTGLPGWQTRPDRGSSPRPFHVKRSMPSFATLVLPAAEVPVLDRST